MAQSCAACGAVGRSRVDGVWYCSVHYDRLHKLGRLHTIRKRSSLLIDGEIARIITPTGDVYTIDVADADLVSRYSWHQANRYARTQTASGKTESLHRILVGLENLSGGLVVDHIDGDPTNNRRSNLRVCGLIQNARNHKRYPGNNPYPGVRLRKSGRYQVSVSIRNKQQYLGTYGDLDSAITARDKAEEDVFGPYRRRAPE